MHFGLVTSRTWNILISVAFRGATLIRGEALIRGRHLFQCVYPKVQCLFEGGTYLRPDSC